MVKGNIASFESMGLVDGPGVRFVVFLQGCPLRCAYCHNPEMWNLNETKMQYTPKQLIKIIRRYKTYFQNGGGVTVSGGEPLMQEKFVTEFFKVCKAEGFHTCLDTSGYGQASDELLDNTDLVLLDVKELDEEKYTALVGKNMKKFNAFLQKCQQKGVKLWLRQVIVPGFNDTEKNVLALKEFASKLNNVEKVELLPYHDMAKKKYQQLGIKYRLEKVPSLSQTKLKNLQKLL